MTVEVTILEVWQRARFLWNDQSQLYQNPRNQNGNGVILNLSSHFPLSYIYMAFCCAMVAIGKSHDGAAVTCPESSAVSSHSLLQRAQVPLCWNHLRKDVPGMIQAHRSLFCPWSPVGHTLGFPPSQTLKSISKAPSLPLFHFPPIPQRTKTTDLSFQICSWGSEYMQISPKPKCLKKIKTKPWKPPFADCAQYSSWAVCTYIFPQTILNLVTSHLRDFLPNPPRGELFAVPF